MKKAIAIRLTSRYLIPFTYDNCKIKYDEVEQETGAWKVAEKNNREKDIYDYISDSFIKKDQCESQDKNNAIACVYKYQNLKQNFKLLYKKKETSFNFYIREVQMILFQNGIGLLWYAPEMRGGKSGTCEFESIEDAAEFVCEFKELARREENNCVYKQDLYDYREGMRIQESDILPGRKKYQKTIKFSMGVWINEILSTLNCNLSYYPYPKTSCVFIFFIIAHQKAENNSSFCQITEFKDQILNIKSISRLFDPQPLTDINQIRIL